jgi:hypothetical protein
MPTEELSRLSPYNITDPLIRNELYREIRNGQTVNNGWTEYEIQPDERLRPELAGYRAYRSNEMKWVVLIAAGLDDVREALTEGVTIKLPSVTWLRERILYYQSK